MLVQKTVTDFVDELASKAPMPGGGGAAALAGALGAALGLMVCNLTEGKAQFNQSAICEIKEEGVQLKNDLTRYVDEDGQSFIQVMTAYRMPKVTEEEKALRAEAIQVAIKNAAHVSFKVADYCIGVMEFSIKILAEGNPNAGSESGASGIVAYAGVHAAIFTVNINLLSITDQSFVSEMREKVTQILEKAEQMRTQVLAGATQVIS